MGPRRVCSMVSRQVTQAARRRLVKAVFGQITTQAPHTSREDVAQTMLCTNKHGPCSFHESHESTPVKREGMRGIFGGVVLHFPQNIYLSALSCGSSWQTTFFVRASDEIRRWHRTRIVSICLWMQISHRRRHLVYPACLPSKACKVKLHELMGWGIQRARDESITNGGAFATCLA